MDAGLCGVESLGGTVGIARDRHAHGEFAVHLGGCIKFECAAPEIGDQHVPPGAPIVCQSVQVPTRHLKAGGEEGNRNPTRVALTGPICHSTWVVSTSSNGGYGACCFGTLLTRRRLNRPDTRTACTGMVLWASRTARSAS